MLRCTLSFERGTYSLPQEGRLFFTKNRYSQFLLMAVVSCEVTVNIEFVIHA